MTDGFEEHRKVWRKKHPNYQKEYAKKWRAENPDYKRKKLSKQVRYAHSLVQLKKLRKDSCENCSAKEDLQAHHPDYSKPDYVITLCRSCHRSIHKREVIANAI